MFRSLSLSAIRFYQKTGPQRNALLKCLNPSVKKTCRFIPTCSEYMYEAIRRYGIVKGVLLGGRRILHCHPWSSGGYNPVPDK